MMHRLLYGHRPKWEIYGYDLLTWRYRCAPCRRQERLVIR